MRYVRLIVAGLFFATSSAAVAQELIDDLPKETKEAAKAANQTKKPREPRKPPRDEAPPLQPRTNTDLIDDLSPEQKKAAAERSAAQKAENAIPDNLADALARALHSSPAVSVAEAKVRQAQAELNEVRLNVVQELTLVFQRRVSNKTDLAEQEAIRAKGVEKGYLTKANTPEISKLRQSILEDETRILYLLGVGADHADAHDAAGAGGSAGGATAMMMQGMHGMGGMGGMMGAGRPDAMMMGMGGGMPSAGMGGGGAAGSGMMMPGMMGRGMGGGMGLAPATKGANEVLATNQNPEFAQLPENLRRFLEKHIDLQFSDQTLSDVLSYLNQVSDGSVDFVIYDDGGSAEVDGNEEPALKFNLSLKHVTVGAALQALADRYELAFIFRDYGILVVTAPGVDISIAERYRAAGTPMIAPPPHVAPGGLGGMGMGGMRMHPMGMGGMMGSMPGAQPPTTPAPDNKAAE